MYIDEILFPRVTNREDFNTVLSLVDDSDGSPIDLSAITFQCEIRRLRFMGFGSPYYDSTIYDGGPVILATLANGFLTVIDLGKLQIRIPESAMKALCAATYQLSMTCTDGTDTRQIFLGRLPVVDGGVST